MQLKIRWQSGGQLKPECCRQGGRGAVVHNRLFIVFPHSNKDDLFNIHGSIIGERDVELCSVYVRYISNRFLKCWWWLNPQQLCVRLFLVPVHMGDEMIVDRCESRLWSIHGQLAARGPHAATTFTLWSPQVKIRILIQYIIYFSCYNYQHTNMKRFKLFSQY